MKTSLILISAIILGSMSFSCDSGEDSLEAVKAFRPEDKYFKAGLVTAHFIRETSSTARADSVFRQLQELFGLPTNANSCVDGVYRGASPHDAYDYSHVVTIRIANEKIVELDYDEIHRSGKGKEGDEAYCEDMSVVGTTPAIAYPVYEREMLEKQDMMAVDGVSGATYSLHRFRYALTIALIKARLAGM